MKRGFNGGGRTGRKTGGGVFSGPGYPGKVPGATGGRTARATGGKTKGKTAIDGQEFHWLRAMVLHFGEEKGRRLAKELFANLEPAPIDGHLALARAVGSGDFWITPANYANLTINQMLSGAPTDYYGLAPIGLFKGA